jgi:hypothetical protein
MESLLNRLPEWIDLEKARAVAVGLEGRGQVRVHDEEFEPGTADAVCYIVQVWKVGWF